MATKINLQQLAKILAQKKDIPQRDAEAFLKEFFDSIIQNVTTDKLVKVKGLGTFKLIEVLDRESVNINTGERIVIPGHTKLSFAPENALKDLINKPFADFQAVVLNEGTSVEEMEWTPSDFTSKEEDNEPEPVPEPVQAFTPVPEQKEEPKLESEPTPEPTSISVPEPKAEPNTTDECNGKKFNWKKTMAWILGLLLLCVIAYFIARSLTQKSANAEPQVVEPQVEAPVEEAPAPEIEYAQVPGGEYKIVGTRKTHIMKPGDYLAKIAREEYGDKEYAKYIIVHNDFPDPDNIPVDMEIKLPELERIE